MEKQDRSFVYIATAGGAAISSFQLDQTSGRLEPLATTSAAGPVIALAVRPDRRCLYASVKGTPPAVVTYGIDSGTGQLEYLSSAPVAESLNYLVPAAGGRFLLGASYGGNLVSVNPVGPEGLVAAEATALLRLGRNPHCIRTDPSERFVYVPHLGSDLIFQFLFDDKTGALTANRPAFIATGFESGPRHLVFSPNHRFAYVLTELSGEVICFSLDPQSGTLTERQRISIVPPGSGLVPGGYRPPVNAKDPGHQGPAKIWGAEIRLTADGSHLYASERSSSTIACFHADSMSGRLEYHGSVPTETQPRGFAIDPKGRFLVASGEVSNHATSYAIDPATGALREVCRVETAAGPNWVEIVNFR